VKIYKLTAKAMKPYGSIIDSSCVKDDGRGNRFGILLKEKSGGWRIGYLILRDDKIKKLESHPDSLETFEPVKGKSVIALALPEGPDSPKLFHLDKPIVLKKKIWHEVLALSAKCEIKIFENIEVKTKYYHLNKPLMV
jgi:ureidoglycolate hydrolase